MSSHFPFQPNRQQKVYIASRYSRRESMQTYAATLMAYGFHVTSRWLHGNHQVTNEQLLLPDAQAELFAVEDLEDIEDADQFIIFTDTPRSMQPSRGGQFVELGYAMGKRIPVTLIGPRSNVFCCLSQVEHYNYFSEFLQGLEEKGYAVPDSELKKGILKK